MSHTGHYNCRCSKAPDLMKDVYLGAVYKDGIVIEPTSQKVAA